MSLKGWIAITILLCFITGFTGGWIYASSLDGADIAEQCSEFIEDHCICYENKPSTNWTWKLDGVVATWNKSNLTY